MAKKKFDVDSFIKGVERPVTIVTLCVDHARHTRIAELMGELDEINAAPDESLGGDPGREAVLAELSELEAGPGWVPFAVRAPSHTARLRYQVALGDSGKGGEFLARFVAAEASMVADCVESIDGNAVSLTVEQATAMLDGWPDTLTNELVTAINELGGAPVSVPFSQRLSRTLETPEPCDS